MRRSASSAAAIAFGCRAAGRSAAGRTLTQAWTPAGIPAGPEEERHAASRGVVLGAHADMELLRGAAAAGAAGYLLEGASVETLVSAIRAVHSGEIGIDPVLAGHLLDVARGGGGRAPRQRQYGLTGREVEVLAEVARGFSDKEIAARLYMAESTVKSHLRVIYRRLRVRNRAQATALAIAKGVLAP